MITDNKVSPASGLAKKLLSGLIVTAVGQTKKITELVQIPHGFQVERVNGYCSGVTVVTSMDVRIARRGDVLDDVVLDIGTQKPKFKLTTTLLRGIARLSSVGGTPLLFYKAAADNIPFSSAFTVKGLAAAVGWGAVRIQIDPATGTITTKVVADNQEYGAEDDALLNCPPPDNGQVDLGTITIEVDATKTFTAQTDDLDDADLTAVNYNGRDSGLVSVLDSEIAFVANEAVDGVMVTDQAARSVAQSGGVIAVDYTTDGDGDLTNGRFNVFYRPYPMYGEPLVRET